MALTRFANSVIHQNVADATTTVRLRLHLDGRTAAGSTTVAAGDGLRGLVAAHDRPRRGCARPTRLARARPAGAARRPTGDWDEATAHAEPDERADRVREFVDAAGGLETAGYCRTVLLRRPRSPTRPGQSRRRPHRRGGDGRHRPAGRRGRRGPAGVRRGWPTSTARCSGARAAAKARAGADPVELPPGRYEVVLEPPAVADLLQQPGDVRVQRQGVRRAALLRRAGRGAVRPGGHPGRRRARGRPAGAAVRRGGHARAPAGARRRRASPRRSPTTGARRRRSAPRPPATRRQAAARLGAFRSSVALLPARAGGRASDADAARTADDTAVGAAVGPGRRRALVAGVERGLLVTDLWYTRVLDPKSLVVTGLTRNGVWLVEDGELTRPVTQPAVHPVLSAGPRTGRGARPGRRWRRRCPATGAARRGRPRPCTWPPGT